MFDPQVVDYIKKALASGQTKEEINSALAENGWSEAEIAENFAEASPQPVSQPQAMVEPLAQPIQPEPEIKQTPIQEPQPMAGPAMPDFGSQQPQQTELPPEEPQSQPQQVQISRPQIQPEPIQPMQEPMMEQPMERPQPISSQPESGGLGMKRESISSTPPYDPMAGKPSEEELKAGGTVYQYQHQPRETKAEKKGNRIIGLILSLAVLIIFVCVGAAAYIYFDLGTYIEGLLKTTVVETETPPVVEEEGQQTAPTTIYAGFLDNTSYTAVLPEYTVTLNELTNLSNFEQANGKIFTEGQKAALANDNFFIERNFDKFYSTNTAISVDRNDDWTGLYKSIGGSSSSQNRQPNNAVFISTDYLTHVYHRLIENEFSYIEEAKLYPILTNLSNSMLRNAANASYTNQTQQESNNRLTTYFLVSSAILNNASADSTTFTNSNYIDDTKTDTKANILSNVDTLAAQYGISADIVYAAKQELNLVYDASRLAASPLFGKYQENMLEDYTQFTPRSHYAKNVILRDYFRAMMWFGRMNFLVKSPELTRDAANMVTMMSDEQVQQWEYIYNPTTFFVGQADDLTITDIKKAITATGFSLTDESTDAITKLQTELNSYSNPLIMSSVVVSPSVSETSKEDLQNSTKGFRFMGQRTTPDAFIFSTLTQGDEAPDPTTGQKLPSTPTALMVSTLMGDVFSKDLLNSWVTTNAPASDKVIANKMADLQTYFNGVSEDQWTHNIYWSWLYTIKSLFTSEKDKTGYPMFMKKDGWNTKSTQAFLGSWTELKHDTLLYAKQSYAELGAGPGEEAAIPAVPKGYVEPNVEFFDRLIALVKTTNKGLTDYDLLPETFQSRNQSFIESLQFFRQIATWELANTTISDDDFEKLRINAYSMDQLLQSPDSQIQLESNARSAIIADVHTDAVKSQILYEADGIPNYIYVAIKDNNGTRLTKGLVYSYYEFTNPLRQRLTDATWQQWNYSSTVKLLKMPDWSAGLAK
jgi:hypothetical protein